MRIFVSKDNTQFDIKQFSFNLFFVFVFNNIIIFFNALLSDNSEVFEQIKKEGTRTLCNIPSISILKLSIITN